MKVRYISALALITALVLTGCGSHQNTDIACDSEGCISPSRFAANIENYISNRVTGYVLIVGELSPIARGYARLQANPPITEMSADLPTNTASLSKTLTTIGVLQSLARHGLTINDRISPYLYPDWVQGPNIDTITFGELMGQISGFRESERCNGRPTYEDLKLLIANGVKLPDKKVASYNNCNFALFRELLPFMEGHPITGSDDQRAEASSAFYIAYMNEHVFRPVGISQRECKPPSTTDVIFSYSSFGWESGTDWGDWTLACGGGGWVLSAADLYAIMNDLANGSALLTPSQKTLMNANCLGWDGSDCSIMKKCPSPYKCKDGFLVQTGGINLRTYWGIFKCNVPVVLIVNSPLPAPYQTIDSNGNPIPGSGDIYDLVRDAYDRAGVAGTPKTCPAG